jgi:hypothetical protein
MFIIVVDVIVFIVAFIVSFIVCVVLCAFVWAWYVILCDVCYVLLQYHCHQVKTNFAV